MNKMYQSPLLDSGEVKPVNLSAWLLTATAQMGGAAGITKMHREALKIGLRYKIVLRLGQPDNIRDQQRADAEIEEVIKCDVSIPGTDLRSPVDTDCVSLCLEVCLSIQSQPFAC